MKLDNLHGTRGNVTETLHEVKDEIEKLIGGAATRNNLARQKGLIELLQCIDVVREQAANRSADWYLEAINNLQARLEGLR